jgi:hypothetical protein
MSDEVVVPQTAETPAPVSPEVAPATVEPAVVEAAKPVVSRASGFVEKMLAERKARNDTKRVEQERATSQLQNTKLKESADRLEYLRQNARNDPSLLVREFNVPGDALIRANLGITDAPNPPTEEELFDKKMEKYLAPFREKADKYDAFIGQSEANAKTHGEVQERLVMENIKTAAKSGDYEWVEHYGQEALDTVREVLYLYWETNGVPLSYADACARVNEHYGERAQSLTQSKAFQKTYSKVVSQEVKPSKGVETAPKTSVSHRVVQKESTLLDTPAAVSASTDRAWQEMKKLRLKK